jgi:single-strand DNA-binding protein
MNETVAALLRSASWTIPGNVGGTPEIKYLSSGNSVCNFNLAVNKPGAKKGDGSTPDWFRIEIWGDQAQVAADQLNKGSRVTVVGRARTERWTDKQGNERVTTIIRADSWSTPDAAPTQAPAAAATAPPVWEIKDDSEVPF